MDGFGQAHKGTKGGGKDENVTLEVWMGTKRKQRDKARMKRSWGKLESNPQAAPPATSPKPQSWGAAPCPAVLSPSSMGKAAAALPSVPSTVPPGLGRGRQGKQWQTTRGPKLARSPVVTGMSPALLPQRCSGRASSPGRHLPFSTRHRGAGLRNS